uniref:NADH dehydrogenase subunit 4L n=1 Tax=Marshallagia marshalli TaxID=106947 RepID=A0A343QXG6_9BILA|nr:NADH dehydrogenase subunit 4L [Marshallagia marshalli]ATV81509.1 NADH dehydrogenase subunit 4L [Marshallagia marshalli]
MFLFISLMILFFKSYRLIFILIGLEFMMMSLFMKFVNMFLSSMFFYFMCFSVISSILGLVIMVGNMKFYGNDYCLF